MRVTFVSLMHCITRSVVVKAHTSHVASYFAMLVCRATISSRFRPSVSALSCVTSYPLSVFVRGTLPVPLSRQLLFRHHNRVSVSLPAAASFRFRFKHSTRNVSSHTFVSHVPFRRSALAGRSSDIRRFPPGPVGFGSAVLPFPFGSRLAAPGAMRRSSPRAPFRQARCLSRRSPRLQASAIAPREHFFLGPGTAHAALPIFRPRKGIEPTRR